MVTKPANQIPQLDRTTTVDVLLGVITALGVAAFFSCSLDDHDSCLFVAGVERFNIAEHRPHPPGYPVYILLAKALTGLMASPTIALMSLSVMASAVSAMLLPRLFRKLGASSGLALVQACLVIVTPCFWLSGSKILTDMPGFALTLMLWLAHLGRDVSQSARRAFWLGVAVGLACGVRTHLILPLIPFLLRGPRWIRWAGVATGFAAWYGGMILHQGIESVIAATEQQALMRFHEPNVSIFVGDGFLRRCARFGRAIAEGTFGLPPWRMMIFVLFGVMTAALLRWRSASIRTGTSIKARLTSPRGLVVLAGLTQFLFVFTFLPAHPRYFLCVLPAAVMLLTFDRTWIGLILIAITSVFTAEHADTLRKVPPPPVQAIAYMDSVDPERKIPLVANKMYSFAREFSPERVRARSAWSREASLPNTPFFTDRHYIPDDLPGYQLTSVQMFIRDESVHDKDYKIRLRLFQPLDVVTSPTTDAR